MGEVGERSETEEGDLVSDELLGRPGCVVCAPQDEMGEVQGCFTQSAKEGRAVL